MGEPFVELGAESVNHLVENYWEQGYDRVKRTVGGNQGENKKGDDKRRRSRRYQLPSPERERGPAVDSRTRARDASFERESETSERVLRAYENERDDPRVKVESVLSPSERSRRSARMSYVNGYAPAQRPRSHDPPRNKYDDDVDSDYDDREGRRYRTSGRGYDDRDDRGYDREVIETERYRGPAGGRTQPYRSDSYRSSYTADPNGAGAGAVTHYRRSQGDVTEYQSRRSRSRGRRDRDHYDRDRSYSRSRSGDDGGWREKLEETFDTSMQGLGVGLAGAVVGGLAGRHFGKEHKNRDIVIGALVGGLGANLAENKYREYKDERRDKNHEREDKWEQKWDGRARSSVR